VRGGARSAPGHRPKAEGRARPAACSTSSCRRWPLEDYLELLTAIEATAEDTGLQGGAGRLPAAARPRLKLLQVTPDPGVIEVNIHPATTGRTGAHTEFLYDAAWQSRLSTEKFMVDGRHTGTGGGNHFVLGGATPADSPFLRRPDAAGQLLAYWHNHPSLSYLFSACSSARPARRRAWTRRATTSCTSWRSPGRDPKAEAADDAAAWLVDRTLRNLLIDVTGNTHRSEFCIDKLYSPDSPPAAWACWSCAPSRCRRMRA
jgi:uncharacterized protein (DUF2126 family)